jgi:hypothetical protein
VTAKWASEAIFHASVFLHFLGDRGSHQELNGQELGLFAKSMLRRVEAEKAFPFLNVGRVVIRLDASTCDPDGMSVRDFRVREGISVSRHDTTDRTANVLVGCVREGSKAWLDGERSNYTVAKKATRNDFG